MIHILNGGTYIEKEIGKVVAKTAQMLDFSDIQGQYFVKRACEVAVSGMHNLLMIGPPGAGKTMTAMRIPTIIPPLDEKEQMELSKIYSVSGQFQLREQLMEERPFRCPHHTITTQGLVGGGTIPKPGEISLAHNGVLFLDEAAEFRTSVLQMLRVPLESGKITISRAGRSTVFPAAFQLLMATNPCPCGNFGSETKLCLCSSRSIEMYWKKISAPLLDRIDIRISVANEIEKNKNEQEYKENLKPLSTEFLRREIAQAVKTQRKRQGKKNAYLTPAEIAGLCKTSSETQSFLNSSAEKFSFSPRATASCLKLARTIADMSGSETIETEHMKEAVMLRKAFNNFMETE